MSPQGEFGLYQNVCLTPEGSGGEIPPGGTWRSDATRILECLVGKAGAGGACGRSRRADVERSVVAETPKWGAWRSLETSSSGIQVKEDGGRGAHRGLSKNAPRPKEGGTAGGAKQKMSQAMRRRPFQKYSSPALH